MSELREKTLAYLNEELYPGKTRLDAIIEQIATKAHDGDIPSFKALQAIIENKKDSSSDEAPGEERLAVMDMIQEAITLAGADIAAPMRIEKSKSPAKDAGLEVEEV